MFSGHGFELSDLNPFNYDYSLSYIDDNLKTVFVDAPVAAAKGVASAAVTTADFFQTVTSSDFWNYYIEDPSRVADAYKYVIDEHPALAATLVAIPAAALAVIAAITAPFTVTIAELGALGAAIFGGAAANAGCSISSHGGGFAIRAPEPCNQAALSLYNEQVARCESSGGRVFVIEHSAEHQPCYIVASCQHDTTVQADEPEQPQAENDWCSQRADTEDDTRYPIVSVTGQCSPYLIEARQKAVVSFFANLGATWLMTKEDGLSCLRSAGIDGANAFSTMLIGGRTDTENLVDPLVTYNFSNSSTVQIEIANVIGGMSCIPEENARPSNMYTCTADVSSAVYTCQNVH